MELLVFFRIISIPRRNSLKAEAKNTTFVMISNIRDYLLENGNDFDFLLRWRKRV